MVRTSIERQPDGTYNVYLEDQVLANLPTWDDAEEFHCDYSERHFGPLRGVKYVDADRDEVLQAEAEALEKYCLNDIRQRADREALDAIDPGP